MVAIGTVVSGLTTLAANERVQAGALRLVKDVYGRIMPSRAATIPSERVEQGLAADGQSATRDELVEALAMLQAQIQDSVAMSIRSAHDDAGRRQRTLIRLLGFVIVLQLAMLGAIFW